MTVRPVERCVELCAEKAWRLAHALLRDPEEAFDAVQQALLVAAAKPDRVPADDPWPWFSVVVAYEAKNLRRKRRPLTNVLGSESLGGGMEKPDQRAAEPSQKAERSEEALRIWGALDRLPAAEREALLLTHVAGMTQAGAAEALGIPRQTVADRAKRGLDALSFHLRGEAGAAARMLAVLPVPPPPQGFSEAMATWTQSALAAPTLVASGTSSVAAAQGAIAMSKLLTIGVPVLAAGIGFFGGATSERTGLFRSDTAVTVSTDAPKALTADGSAPSGPGAGMLEGDPGAAALEERRLRAENSRLADRLQKVEQELAGAKAAKDGTGLNKGPTFLFGEMGQLPAIRETNWAEMAEAADAVSGAVIDVMRARDEGKEVSKETHLRLQENVERIRKYEYRTVDKMPTVAKYNGELTHPISVANLLAGQLERAGQPMTAAQIAQVDKLGVAFDEEFARRRASWGPEVIRARRMLAEYQVKGQFTDAVWALLTPEQRAVWIDPALRGVAGIDLFDPTLMIIHTSPVVGGESANEIRTKLDGLLRPKVGLAPEAVSPRYASLIDAFVSRTTRSLEPVPAARVRNYTYAEGLAAGEATADLVEGLLHDVEMTPALRQALVDDYSWYIPRLVRAR